MRATAAQGLGWTAGLLAWCLLAAPVLAAASSPPDLRLEWLEAGRPTREAGSVSGTAGETLRLPYQLRNIGGADAFAAVLSVRTTLGPLGRAERFQPGPDAGEEVPLWLALPLARGMREVCVEVRLQTLDADDPGDPNRTDNRLCRKVSVEPDKEQESGRREDAAGKERRP
ncbi:MAG: hypothetical protein R2991_11280 [Thermoanaerobaculia bacterium]